MRIVELPMSPKEVSKAYTWNGERAGKGNMNKGKNVWCQLGNVLPIFVFYVLPFVYIVLLFPDFL